MHIIGLRQALLYTLDAMILNNHYDYDSVQLLM